MQIKWIDRGICYPEGFLASGVNCGIKKGRLDLGVLYSPNECYAAATFTTNKVKAAPVQVSSAKLNKNKIYQAIVVNSGNANCCTGNKGLLDAQEMCRLTAQELSLPEEKVLVCSTGVIGEPLPMENITNGIKSACSSLNEDDLPFAEAIMTTDTKPKRIAVEATLDEQTTIKIGGCAKGAGMIYPNMATMLAFITTDVEIPPDILQEMLKNAVEQSFNRISVDGDQSTNDTVILLSKKGRKLSEKQYEFFQNLLTRVCESLALMIVKDGEGATKVAKIIVKNAATPQDAEKAARKIGNSLLFKTALFGEDPNWGRIMGALGAADIALDPNAIDIWFDDVQVVSCGMGMGKETEEKAKIALKKDQIVITVDLKIGEYQYHIWTCDLSYDYVRINAEYRS